MSAYLITELKDGERVYGVCYVKLSTNQWVACEGLIGVNPLADIEQALLTLRKVTKDITSTVLVLSKGSSVCIKEFMEASRYYTIHPKSISGLYPTHRGSRVVELPTEIKWSDYAEKHYSELSNTFQIIKKG